MPHASAPQRSNALQNATPMRAAPGFSRIPLISPHALPSLAWMSLMKANNAYQLNKRLGSVLIAVAMSLLAATASFAQASQEQALAALKKEFSEVKTELMAAQREALQDKAVLEAIADEQAALKSAMLAEAPSKDEQIESFFELRETAAEKQGRLSKKEKQKIAKLNQSLQPVVAKAQATPTVKAAQHESRQAIITAMSDATPKTPQLLERQNRLMQRYRQLTAAQ